MGSKKKRKRGERPTIHPRNKYSENPPDFGLLASLYPSFEPYVFYARDGRPRIDWTDFNATRELTRILLLHDHGLNWWIPDGQLCPTVPNRSNYIHWIEDLLSSEIIPYTRGDGDVVKGFDIGTGANCIYPLLGASLYSWMFVGSDITDVALEYAEKNVTSNPQISDLIEIRKVEFENMISDKGGSDFEHVNNNESTKTSIAVGHLESSSPECLSILKKRYSGPPILVGVVKDGEKFDFCMCNPPFFETIEEAGQNPKTSCGGSPAEMVCPGGEQAFITRIIEDSVKLKESFRWYTSMVGRKSNLKILVSKLWEVGVSVVKTTEFVQGQTCRWGLAWSFMPPMRKTISSNVIEKSKLSFMLEGLQRQYSAFHVLQAVETFFCGSGASCKLDAASFSIDITVSKEQCDAILKTGKQNPYDASNCQYELESTVSPSSTQFNELSIRISVFQQIPGTLTVKGSSNQRQSQLSGVFLLIFQQLESVLKGKFCRERAANFSCAEHNR